MQTTTRTRARSGHPPVIRVTHWIAAYAMLCMILSGWQIYNASPILPFTFPAWATLGGWLGGALAWHFAAMWLLVADGTVYLGYGILSGYFGHSLWPLRPSAIIRDLWAALTLRLGHASGEYNAVQKLLYLVVLLCSLLIVCSGLAIYKPVQLAPLTALLGGYDTARIVHFALMSVIVGFLFVHVVLVAIVPSTLLSMTVGARREPRGGRELLP